MEIPFDRITGEISFNRVFHLSILLPGLFIFVMSILLVNKYYAIDDWRIHLGTGGVILSGITLLYYLIWGRNIGELTIETKEGNDIYMMTHKSNFEVVKTKIKVIKQGEK